MEKIKFGKLGEKEVYEYVISNGNISASILTYGGIVRKLFVPDKNGKSIDIVLGYNSIEEYELNDGYLGAIIGRVANRIKHGKFILNGERYQTTINNGNNSLHGGIKGFNSKIWNVEDVKDDKIILTYFSKDKEEGYPSNLQVKVTYSITDGNSLQIEYEAQADNDTIINLTNHSYFNLDGEGNGNILNTYLRINSEEITPVNSELIPYNKYKNVKNTAFDFRKAKRIGEEIDINDEQLKICGGYDINYVLNGKGYKEAVSASSEKSGIAMKVFTDQYGVQLYSGNFLTKRNGKTGEYNKRSGFCLETQNFPNAINCDKYPSMILRKGEKYSTKTSYCFYTK